MKFALFIGLLVVGAVFCEKAAEDDVDSAEAFVNDIISSFREFVKEKCVKIGAEFDDQQFHKTVEEVGNCFINNIPNNPEDLQTLLTKNDDDDSLEELCSDKRHIIKKCLEKAVPIVTSCCAPDEKYFPDFILSAFDGIWDFACDNGGSIIKKTDKATTDCVNKIFYKLNDEEVLSICDVKKFKILRADLPDDFIGKKEDVCHDLDELKTCSNKIITAICPNEKHLHDAVIGIHKAVTGACHESN